ncbi:MAG: hypothetical protein Fur0035_11220 [Anaerolineales bacterium]
MSDETQRESFSCSECQAGVLSLNFITYFTWLDDELVTVPNFPAWICDVCGRREYDERAVSWLATLLSPSAGQSAHKKPSARPLARRRNNAAHHSTDP